MLNKQNVETYSGLYCYFSLHNVKLSHKLINYIVSHCDIWNTTTKKKLHSCTHEPAQTHTHNNRKNRAKNLYINMLQEYFKETTKIENFR